MVTLQFWRGHNSECLIDTSGQAVYKIAPLGYPLISFVSDLEITINDAIENPHSVSHLYWGAPYIQQTTTSYDAMICHDKFQKIFNENLQNGKSMDLKMFEDIAISNELEVPSHGIRKQEIEGKEVICDLYRCFYVKGETPNIIDQLCIAELHYLATNGYTIKRCENCGKLFVPKKADEKYCIRRSKEYPNMNCKQAAKYKKQLLRESNNESARIYHSIYTMLAKRCKDASPSSQSQAQKTLLNFADDAKEWKNRIKINPEIESEYIDWLNSFKKRKSKR